MPRHPKRPRDQMQLAELVGEIAVGDLAEESEREPDAMAVKRGQARADKLSPGIDYAMLFKLYGPAPDEQRRYSAPELLGVEKTWIMGQSDASQISTGYAESQNTWMRTNIRRLTRLTNGHCKKLENHVHAMALWFMYYNYCRVHMTLTKQAGGIKSTAAMVAGVVDHV